MTMLTKGKMVTELKKKGVRVGEKDSAIVGISHLKTFAVIKLYFEHCGER